MTPETDAEHIAHLMQKVVNFDNVLDLKTNDHGFNELILESYTWWSENALEKCLWIYFDLDLLSKYIEIRSPAEVLG